MTDRERTIQEYVRHFERRHYPGKGPSQTEIQGWCTKNISHLERSLRREIERTIANRTQDLYHPWCCQFCNATTNELGTCPACVRFPIGEGRKRDA